MKITIPTFLKNKFAFAALVFFIWMLFFDRNSMINQYRLISSLNGLKARKEYYTRELQTDSAALHILMTSEEELEKFAREKYLMKRDNEDIFLIIKK
ncbi:MAG: FtsB family cell division protein [Bacteroidales bacterium]